MNPSTKAEIKGNFHEVKGKVKEKADQVKNNLSLQADGKAEHNAGKVEKKVGQIEKVFEKQIRRARPEHGPAFGTTDAPPFPARCRSDEPAGLHISAPRSHFFGARTALRWRLNA